MSRYGGRYDNRLVETLYEMISVLVYAAKRGKWRIVHSILLVGVVLDIIGLLGFIFSVLSNFVSRHINNEQAISFFILLVIGLVISLTCLFIIRLSNRHRKY